MKSNKATLSAVLLGAIVAMTSAHAGNSDRISSPPQPVPPVANPCPRLAASSGVEDPPALFSRGGVLTANFSYETTSDEAGRTLFCFMTPDGLENPTLHVRPGDHLVINVTNNTPWAPVEMEINPPKLRGHRDDRLVDEPALPRNEYFSDLPSGRRDPYRDQFRPDLSLRRSLSLE